MSKSSTHSIFLVLAVFLGLMAQSLMLAPHIQNEWAKSIHPVGFFILGSFAYSISAMILMAIILNRAFIRRAFINLTGVILVGIIAVYYMASGFYVESLILVGMTLSGIPLMFFLRIEDKNNGKDFLNLLVPALNTVIGMGLFLAPKFLLVAPIYARIEPVRIILAIGFIAAGIFGGYAMTRSQISRGNSARIVALPWLVWVIFFSIPTPSAPNILPPLSLGLVMILEDIIPWKRLILPQNDVLGHRLLRIAIIANILILLFASGAIYLGEQAYGYNPVSSELILRVREIALVIFNIVSFISVYTITVVNLSINRLMGTHDPHALDDASLAMIWSASINRAVEPLAAYQNTLKGRITWQEKQISLLSEQLSNERHHAIQLSLLKELSLQLESVLDQPVSAQLTANVLQRAFGSILVAIMQYDIERNEMVVVAAAGRQTSSIPPGYRQGAEQGLVGRAARTRKSQVVNDTRGDEDHFMLETQSFLSEIVVPLLHKNQLRGVIVVDDERQNAFESNDVDTVEAAGAQLMAAWERSIYDQRLTELIQGGIALSSILETDAALDQVAAIAQQTLNARFVFVSLTAREGMPVQTAYSGYAPALVGFLSRDPSGNALLQKTVNGAQVYRLRDVRKEYPNMLTGNVQLRSLLAMPIRMRGQSIGAILAFGKQGDLTFSDSDEALGNLLSNQAAAAIETARLYQELRATLNTVSELYNLSTRVIQSEKLTDAAAAVAQSALNLSNASAAGIMLFTPDQKVEAQVQIDKNGLQPGTRHPLDLIHQTRESGRIIYITHESITHGCLPLQTPHRQYGVLWIEISTKLWENNRHSENNLRTLANQAAIALERSILLVETQRQAKQLEDAYAELETTYDQTLIALTTALDARDRETEGHSVRVTKMALMLGREMGLTHEQLKVLERGALLHDIGKIGISDMILHKPGSLNEDEWYLMRQHPDIGARIIEGIPFLQEAMPVIRYHQERWNGSGYPIGLKGQDIPIFARIFAVGDTFDALTSTRPYRKKGTVADAITYLKEQASVQFDPQVVAALAKLIESGEILPLISET